MVTAEPRPRPPTREHPDPAAETANQAADLQQWHLQQRSSGRLLERRLLLRLTALVTVLWVLAVGSGALLNNGIPPDRAKLPLTWFDRLMRSYGPLLPVPVLLLRWYATLPPAGPRATTGSPSVEVLVLYLGVTAGRLALHSAHLLLGPLIGWLRGASHTHLVSDHIFLGAALTAIFSAEAHLLAADVRRSWAGRRLLDKTVLTAAGATLAALFALTCVEMHVTARHFHAPVESVAAIATGLACFQVPVTAVMLRVLS